MNDLIRRLAMAATALAVLTTGCMDRAENLQGTGGSGAVEEEAEAAPQDTTDDLESGATTSGSPTDTPSDYDTPAETEPEQ